MIIKILLFVLQVLLLLMCGAASVAVAAGGAVAWPGAAPLALAAPAHLVRTIFPPHTKTVAYSSTQYINNVSFFLFQVIVYYDNTAHKCKICHD